MLHFLHHLRIQVLTESNFCEIEEQYKQKFDGKITKTFSKNEEKNLTIHH